MRLAFSTNAYLKFPFDQAAGRLAALGYEGLELLADVPHAWPAGLLEESKKAIGATMDRLGLEFSNINAFMMNAVADHRQPYWHPSFIEPDAGYRQVRIDHTRRALSLCAELGAPHITTEPGGPLGPGQSREMGCTYGTGVVSSGEGGGRLGLTVSGSFVPGGTFTLTALVSNPAAGERLTLHLPDGFSIAEGGKDQAVPPASGASQRSPVTWKIRSPDRIGKYTLRVLSSIGTQQSQPVTIKPATGIFN